MLKDNQRLKIQGICGSGFWLRLIEVLPSTRILAERWIQSQDLTAINTVIEMQSKDVRNHTVLMRLTNQKKAEWFDRILTELEMKKEISKDKFSGSLIGYKEIEGKAQGFPIFALETFVEHFYGDELQDKVVKAIYDAQNKLHAIDALFESVEADLNLVELEHFDDNSKEIAGAVKNQLIKLRETFYEKVHESDGDWRKESLSGILYRLSNDHHQVMVIPELRRCYFEDIAGYDADLTKEQKEVEIESWVDAIREQFDLSTEWR